MRIAAANVQKFHYRSNVVPDSEGHGHPGPEQHAVQSLLTITGSRHWNGNRENHAKGDRYSKMAF